MTIVPNWSHAQEAEGDQFLDGIGETALVARYVLNGNLSDSSRNQLHASIHGATAAYVNDETFGRVLSLTGGNGGFLQFPNQTLEGLDSVSVTGWIYLRSDAPWQRFFDFGRGTQAYLFCTPVGGQEDEGLRARITTEGAAGEKGPTSQRVPRNAWIHLAVVLDATNGTLSTYTNGRRVESVSDIQTTLEDVLDTDDEEANQLYIGKSQYDSDATLDAKLHDVRLYSVALTGDQVATIYRNARSGRSNANIANTRRRPRRPKKIELPVRPIVPAESIASVPDVTVDTVVGDLPRLPLRVPVVLRDGSEELHVRVIWPSPKDNNQVAKAGTYTVTGEIPGTELAPKAIVNVVPASKVPSTKPERVLETFPLSDVALARDAQGQATPFIENRDKFIEGLAATNPDSFLYMFRDTFGQQQPEGARPLGGWDSQTTRLRGHATGHYLSAIAQAYASTDYDPELQSNFKQKMDYLVDTLYELSRMSGRPAREGGPFNADPTMVPPGPENDGYDSDLSAEGSRRDYWNWGEGFISAYPPDQFIMLEQGASYGGNNSQVWAPYYTLHKILAGLLDCYEVGGNKKALEVAHDMGLWVFERLRQLPPQTRIEMWNRYIAGEYGGMNEVLARLYRLTDDERFLECAQLFDNINFFFGNPERSHGLARNVDTIRGKHANQHIPQIIGALETYRCTDDPQYYLVADNFWHLCTGNYMYAIGGVAGASNPNNAECFTAEPNSLYRNGFSPGGQNETCATYNLLKLSRQLFLYDPRVSYMDHYEQALYNHILASVDEDNPGNTYHVPLNPGSRKQFGNESMTGFTCCNGTALESSTKLQDSIYFKSADGQTLYVNLFVSSTLNWRERDVLIRQNTSFPYSDRTEIIVEGSGDFEIRIRVPSWTSDVELSVNGEKQSVEATPGHYLSLSRNWQPGDTIELRMPFHFRLERVMDRPNLASIFYGPVLMAVEESGRLSNWRQVTLNIDDLSQSIQGDPSTLRFQIGELRLKPFFDTYDRYSVYLDVVAE